MQLALRIADTSSSFLLRPSWRAATARRDEEDRQSKKMRSARLLFRSLPITSDCEAAKRQGTAKKLMCRPMFPDRKHASRRHVLSRRRVPLPAFFSFPRIESVIEL
jgi:hypothetical protein